MNTKAVWLMNIDTGSVETAEDWAFDGYTQENARLIPVVSVDGVWVEASEIEDVEE